MSCRNIIRYKGIESGGKFGVVCSINNLEDGYPLHRHDYITIEYLVSGEIIHEINGQKTVLKAGDCWCLDHQDIHMCMVLEPAELYSVCIDLQTVPEAIRQFITTISFPRLGKIPHLNMPLTKTLFYQLLDVTQREQPYAKEKTIAHLILFLLQILEYCQPVSKREATSGQEHVAKAVEYIAKNFSRDITLETVASEVHLSPNYFSRTFYDVTGYSFGNYLSYARIEKAREILSDPDIPIISIAEECGFGSFSNFSRLFKKYVGCTPSDYRKGLFKYTKKKKKEQPAE